MAKPKKTTKIKTAIVRTREVWKTAYTTDVKYDSISYSQLMQLVHDHVPPGTPLTDIKFEFDVGLEWGYYDDYTTEAKMSINYKTVEEF